MEVWEIVACVAVEPMLSEDGLFNVILISIKKLLVICLYKKLLKVLHASRFIWSY